ncbi:hypothetical protein FVER14953_21357 [Fusarium verticillioides]|nr:hypothetical protein FVER14953_21357 [Fusarium verticillioides]
MARLMRWLWRRSSYTRRERHRTSSALNRLKIKSNSEFCD